MESPIVQQPQQRIRRSPEQWQALVDQFESSGMTQRAFCLQAGISYGTFSRWRRRLISPDSHQLTAAGAGLFVELSEGATPPPASPPWDVELQLGHDVFLRLRHQPC